MIIEPKIENIKVGDIVTMEHGKKGKPGHFTRVRRVAEGVKIIEGPE